MAEVWVGRFNRGVEKLFNVKGGPTVVDVEPSIRIAYAWPAPTEERYLFGVESFAAGDQQGAVAANKSAFMIRNPSGSGVIAVIEKLSFSYPAGILQVYVAGSNPADLATSVASHSRADPRGRSVGSCVVSRDAPAVDPGTGFLTIGLFQPAGNVTYDLMINGNDEILLLPGIALRGVEQTVNQALNFAIFWRERSLESSELT